MCSSDLNRGGCGWSTDFSSPDETHTAEMIDQMFEDVLEMATDGCQEDHDSGIAAGSTEKDAREPLAEEEERSEEESEGEAERRDVDTSGDELTFPPSGILSPLGKSVEAVVTPMVSAAGIPPSRHASYSGHWAVGGCLMQAMGSLSTETGCQPAVQSRLAAVDP